jgi:hypothetical protein
VGAIAGSVSYNQTISGYVAVLDLSSGSFTPVVTQLATQCRSLGNGQVSLLPTATFAASNHTLLAITANSGPGLSNYKTGTCGVPDGVIVANAALVNPGQTSGPVLYFTTRSQATITSGSLPQTMQWAVAGTTNTNDDCPNLYQIGTLLVNGGQPGTCAIPKATVPAGRGAAGLDPTGTMLIIAVVEGNDGAGLKTSDFADLLIGLGAVNAVNFDGGGSTVFYWTPSGSAPSQSAKAAQILQNAKFPAGQPNPNNLSFSVKLLDQTQKYTYDAAGRPIYASLGFTYSSQ